MMVLMLFYTVVHVSVGLSFLFWYVSGLVTAERMRLQYPNSRVLYGNDSSFPGKGKGKFKGSTSTSTTASSRTCAVWDTLYVMGQPLPRCRQGSNTGDVRRRGERDDDEVDDDRSDRRSSVFGKRGKGRDD